MKSLIIFICFCLFANFAKADEWRLQPGAARDIAVGANGDVWSIGNTPTDGSYNIQRWNGNTWINIDGGGIRIAVDPAGNPWVINRAYQIFKREANRWVRMPGAAIDIGIGANGDVWVIGTDDNILGGGGKRVYKFINNNWTVVEGGGERISVGPNGQPYIVNSGGAIYERLPAGNWRQYPGFASDISVGANGSLWVIGSRNSINRWNADRWEAVDGGGTEIAVDPTGLPWIANHNYEIYRRSNDRDFDGLLDEWETTGFGPINPAIHNVNPNRADMFIWVTRRLASTSQEMLEIEFEKVKQFFSRLPNRNPDGSTGINVIVLYGGVLPPTFANVPYTAPGVYEACVPAEWRNYAHGYLAEPGEGGAGQTSGRLTAGGYGWQIVVHEIGHQLGLSHTPPNGIPSPFYTSLMNYDYCYSFNGDADAVHFSNGAFTNMHLTENNLDENINLPQTELAFLTMQPYNFRTQNETATTSTIDWNRNGIFGEVGVAADINEGYAVSIGTGELHLNTTSGSPALASVGANLFLIYPKLQGTLPETWVTAQTTLPASGTGGYHLYFQRKTGAATITDERLLLPSLAASDPSAIGFGNKLVVGFVLRNRVPMINAWVVNNAGTLVQRRPSYDLTQTADQVALTVTGTSQIPNQEKLWMLTWSANTREVKITELNAPADNNGYFTVAPNALMVASGEPVLSESPIGVTYNRATQKLILVTTGTYMSTPNRIKVSTFYFQNGNGWIFESMEWVGGSNIVTTNTAPTVIINDLYSRGREGELCIFVKGNVPVNDNSQIFRLLKINDPAYPGGWKVKKIRDDWTTTRSAPALAICNNDLFFALRWCCGEHVLNNRIVLFDKASGIESVEFMDFDDITHIATTGLRSFIIR